MNRTIVIYYTFEGNTGFVAETIRAQRENVTLEQLRAGKEPPRKGPGKFLVGGGSALMGWDPKLAPIQADPGEYDNVILAFPIWAGTCPPAIGAFLAAHDLSGKNVYAIACSGSGNAGKSVDFIRARVGERAVKGSLSLMSPLSRKEESVEQIRSSLGEWGL